MAKITLKDNQAQVLQKIARRSKMNTWFDIKDNKVNKADIKTLFEGATAYDLETVTPDEIVTIIDIMFSIGNKS